MITNNFKRIFYFFIQEDSGFSKEQASSGYVRIEINDKKGRLIAHVQDLKENSSEYKYKLYLIKQDIRGVFPILVSTINLNHGRGDVYWEFDTLNICNTGTSINDITIFAIVAEYNDKREKISVPLVAYTNKKCDWKMDFYKYNKERKEIKKIEEIKEIKEIKETKETNIAIGNSINNIDENNVDEKHPTQILEKADVKFKFVCNGTCSPFCEDEHYKPCFKCFEHEDEKKDVCFEDYLNRKFKRFNPFYNMRSDYRWWKVPSYHDFKNLVAKYSVDSSAIIEEFAETLSKKYIHMIVGVYQKNLKSNKYYIFGFPGVLGVDKSPFKVSFNWLTPPNVNLVRGIFGYYLMYIECKKD